MFMKKLIVSILIIYLLISMVGCGGVPTTPPISSESELVLVRVTDPKSNIISVAGIENEDAMAILGDKDIDGNPINITGAIYVSDQGDSFGIKIGEDGLPSYLIDSESNQVIFENYTNSTAEISIYDSNGTLIQDSITLNLNPEDLMELKQLYNDFNSKGAKWSNNDTQTAIILGSVALNAISCGVAAVGAVGTGGILTPVVGWACGSFLLSAGAAVTQNDIDDEISTTIDVASAFLEPISYTNAGSAVLDALYWGIEVGNSTNQPPTITSTPITSATIGQLYSYDVRANDPNGDVLTYSLTNNPIGMEMAPTGFISWIPTASGNFDVIIEVSDGEFSAIQSFTITVEETDTSIGQIQLSTPLNGATVNTSTAVLSWQPIAGVSGYEVVYDTSSSFTNPIAWSVSSTSKTTGTLTDGTTYYWRVRAFTGSQYSSWSSVWSFTKSGAIVPQDVTLILYICENSTSGPPLSGVSIGIVDGGGNSFSQTTNSSGYITITGTPGTWYFSALKSGYDTNSWSQSIITNCTKYGYIVKSVTPVGAIDVFATLNGSAWVGSLSYSLTGPSSLSGSTVPAILSNKPIGSYSITFNSGGPSNASLSSITPSSTQTLSESGIIAFTLNFTGSTLLPPTGFSVSSYWNTVTGFPSMNLSWNAVSGAKGYEMWVRPFGGSYAYLGTRYAPYVTFNSNSLPGSVRYVSGTTYYFKVCTVTASDTSDYTSEVPCVAAASPSLGQVQLSGPSNGATLPPMSVKFWWNSVSNTTKYQFILYNQQGQVALDTIKTSTSLIVALGTEETITWKVRAGDNSGNWGAWSSTWSLIIKSLT
jgi:hypothetical protein